MVGEIRGGAIFAALYVPVSESQWMEGTREVGSMGTEQAGVSKVGKIL